MLAQKLIKPSCRSNVNEVAARADRNMNSAKNKSLGKQRMMRVNELWKDCEIKGSSLRIYHVTYKARVQQLAHWRRPAKSR